MSKKSYRGHRVRKEIKIIRIMLSGKKNIFFFYSIPSLGKSKYAIFLTPPCKLTGNSSHCIVRGCVKTHFGRVTNLLPLQGVLALLPVTQGVALG